MKSFFVFLFGFCIHLIYGFNTYPPNVYDSLKVISRQRNLDKTYFQHCAYIGSMLAGDISVFNSSEKTADEILVPIVSQLNERLLTINNIKINKIGDGEESLIRIFEDVLKSYLLLVATPTTSSQYGMRFYCSSSSNEINSLIDKFDPAMNMIARSYLAKFNFTDTAFEEVEEISQSIASQIAVTYSICESFLGSSTESTIKNLENMMKMLNNKLHSFNEDRRQKFWNTNYISAVIQKMIFETRDDQDLVNKIQHYFEKNFNKTDYVFSVFLFNNTHPFVATDNIHITDYNTNQYIILTRYNERNHCEEYDTIESNVQQACIEGSGTKVENIINYLTEKCSNATVLVMNDSIDNYVFSTNKLKPNIKISNMSNYAWTFLININERCLKRVLIAIINN